MNHLILFVLSFGLAFAPVFSHALDFSIEPRVQTGIMDYVFEQKSLEISIDKSLTVTDSNGTEVVIPPGETYTDSDGSITSNGSQPDLKKFDSGYKLISYMPLLGVGATAFSNRFFLDFYVQKALSDSDSSTNTQRFSSESQSAVNRSTDYVIASDFDRNEYSLAFGYSLSPKWVLFTGYRKATTDFDDSYSYKTEQTYSDGASSISRARGESSISFDQDGFFLGSTYAYSFREHAIITFSAAVAALEGEYDSRGNIVFGTTNLDPSGSASPERYSTQETGYDQKGDTVGLNLGVKWRGRIAESVGYSLGLDGYSYDFKAKTADAPDLSETVLRFMAGLSYQF